MLSAAHEELLGCLIAYPGAVKEYDLEPELFRNLRWLYELMRKVEAEEGYTYRGLINRLSAGQIRTVQSLRSLAYSENRIPLLIQQAKKDLLAERLRSIGLRLAGSEYDPDDMLRELQEQVERLETSEFRTLSNTEKDVEDFFRYMEEIAADPQKAYGLMTGISELDTITTGFHRQDFSVVGARTSMGKSAFMLQIALNLHLRGYKVAIYSLEMSKRQIYIRLMANLLGIDAEVFKLGKADPSYYKKMREYKDKLVGMYIDDTRGVTCEYIADSMRRLKRTQGLDFVVVDYIQDIKEPGEANDNQGSALGRVCRKLRKAAQEFDCHVMGLSQISREAEKSVDKRPTNKDLAGSTGIETSADVIALLYRDDYYNPDTDKKNILEVNFTKQRNGKLGKVELYYDRTTQRITSLARGYSGVYRR